MPDASDAAADGSEESLRTNKVIYSDLNTEQNTLAVSCVNTQLDSYTTDKDVATALKKEFDAKYGGTWQAIVGSCFGCSLTHKTKAVLHFQIDFNPLMYVLLFQSDE
ncbi:hypothetical protein TrRE_jg4779 [Triparma retinervis]|uniref:Dynein light chain n=1 Tax=Triparma retinervis TaxID=2557542 RepID=A0A9W7L5Y1_9STRA|nr:hypothetical protein TrRE_jg4779 [Triparma retinervis]